MYNETVVRSHDSIDTKNVHFIVHPGGSLAFDAKAVVLTRDEVRVLCSEKLNSTSDAVYDTLYWYCTQLLLRLLSLLLGNTLVVVIRL